MANKIKNGNTIEIARAGREAFDAAVKDVITEGVDGEGRRLPFHHLAELCLFKIGDEIDGLSHRNDCQQVRAGLNELTLTECPVADHAIDRGRDRGVVKIEFCLLEIDLGSLQAGARRAFEGSQTIRLLLSGLIARFGLVERCLFLLEIGVRLMRPLDGSRAADQEIAVAFLFFGREVESCRRMGELLPTKTSATKPPTFGATTTLSACR
jgi:hypothetical protein